MISQLISVLFLVSSIGVILVQRCTINSLQTQLETSAARGKRSIHDNAVYVPVYAQISLYDIQHHLVNVSEKGDEANCKQHYKKAQLSSGLPYTHYRALPDDATTTTTTTTTLPPIIQRKHCTGEAVFREPRRVGVRPNRIGSAMRDGHEWYITEFHMGYSVLQFSNARSLNNSEPRAIITLPYPFLGTDATVHNSTAYYNYGTSLVSYHLKTGATRELSLQIGQEPLYRSSNSLMDIQADEHGLWVLFREPGQRHPTVDRLVPGSLKVISSWSLTDLDTSTWCNSMIRCGILYSLECSDGARLKPVYDFYQNMHISGKETVWRDLSNLSSAQYDPRSKSIAVFANGNVYTIETN